MENSIFPNMTHCDDIIDDESYPKVLRDFLRYNRLPAICRLADQPGDTVEQARQYMTEEVRQHIWTDPEPVLFATYEGVRVRVVMASRFGDVGITQNLAALRGYTNRVPVDVLTNFSETP